MAWTFHRNVIRCPSPSCELRFWLSGGDLNSPPCGPGVPTSAPRLQTQKKSRLGGTKLVPGNSIWITQGHWPHGDTAGHGAWGRGDLRRRHPRLRAAASCLSDAATVQEEVTLVVSIVWIVLGEPGICTFIWNVGFKMLTQVFEKHNDNKKTKEQNHTSGPLTGCSPVPVGPGPLPA